MDNPTWIIEAGDAVIQNKAHNGIENLTQWELLVYCLWVADYGMRNAGDLHTAEILYQDFQSDAQKMAERLLLPFTYDAFSRPRDELEAMYFDWFDAICEEIISANPGDRPKRGSE